MSPARIELNLYAAIDLIRAARQKLEGGRNFFYTAAWRKLCRIEDYLSGQLEAQAYADSMENNSPRCVW